MFGTPVGPRGADARNRLIQRICAGERGAWNCRIENIGAIGGVALT
jgi:hypothetical protein